MPLKYMVLMPIVKGIGMAVLLETILEPSFIQTMAVAATSATISGVFLLLATHMNTKRTMKPTEELKETIEEKLPDDPPGP